MTEVSTPAPVAAIDDPAPRVSKSARITGIVLSTLVVLWVGVAGAFFALTQREMVMRDMVDKFHYPASAVTPIQIAAFLCVILYAVPRTAVLGALLLTGYLGGAVSSHVRIGDGLWFVPIVFAVLVWLGIYLREPRLRALVPLRKA